jgi:hypothetical protein
MKTFIKLMLFVIIVFAIAALARPVPLCGQEEEKEPAEAAAAKVAQKSAATTTAAVKDALDWLERHQHPEGYWDSDGFAEQCTGDESCSGKGQALNDVGVTGLALLAFLEAKSTVTAGPYKKAVMQAAKYLCDVQDPEDGCMVPKESTHYMYNHAISSLAMIETYGRSKWPILKKHAQRAVDFIHESKNPGKAWRYNLGEADPEEQNDTSVTGWMVLCLIAAEQYGLDVDKQDLRDALKFIDAMTDAETGRTGYMYPGSFSSREAGDETIWPFGKTEALTALAMTCRILSVKVLGDTQAQKESLEAGAELLRAKAPEWDSQKGTIDYYYWFHGAKVIQLTATEEWKEWKAALLKALMASQSRKGCEKGSWDPQKDPWGDNGGRVYSTALLVLCLQSVK